MRSMEPVPLPDRISGFRSTVINGILDYLESLRPIATRSVRTEWRSDGLALHSAPGGGDVFPFDKMSFGYSITGAATVKIYGGEIQIGSSAAVSVADTNVTISSDYSYVGIRYVYSTKTLSIVNFGTSITYNGEQFQKWLYEFRLVSGYTSLYKIGWLNFSIPSIYADEPT